jgi:hypothetical protein
MSLPSKSRSGDGTYPRTKLEVGLTVGGCCEGGGEGGTKSLGNLLVIVRSRVKIRSATLPGLSSDEFLPRRCKSPASRVDGCGAGSCISVESIGVGVTTRGWSFTPPGSWSYNPRWSFTRSGSWSYNPRWSFTPPGSWSYNPRWSFTRSGSWSYNPRWSFTRSWRWSYNPGGVSLPGGVGVTTPRWSFTPRGSWSYTPELEFHSQGVLEFQLEFHLEWEWE